MDKPRTMFEKIWESHVVHQDADSPAVLYIDMHLIHEVTSPQAFAELRKRGLPIWDNRRIKATIDHCNRTILGDAGDERSSLKFSDELSITQILQLEKNCEEFGVDLYGLDNPSRGVIHVFAPEMGLTQPGMTIVCGDSHTATHGAFGALAFGIGTSEVGHVMGTQCLMQYQPKTMRIHYIGRMPQGTSAKDLILHTIREIGVAGGTNYAIEFTGEAVRSMSMEGRMTLCNMAIEAGARNGMVAPDETTFAWLKGRPYSLSGADWDAAVERWKKIASDQGAVYDKTIEINIENLQPMVTFGTNPGMACGVTETVPVDGNAIGMDQNAFSRALNYMNIQPASPIREQKIDQVFIGSCTNGRLEDLRSAAAILRGHKIADGVKMTVVPGSDLVKRQAEAEGLDKIFIEAGAEWHQSGCSLCLSMNGDVVEAGKTCVSTSNRNFEGRQGAGARTILASPATAAASAIFGRVSDPREIEAIHA